MKDEIKEILDKWNKVCNGELEYIDLTLDKMTMLRDYITNLQEENEIYKKELEKADSITQSCIFEGSRSAGKSYRQCLNWLEYYKSRNKKAIELLKDIKYDLDIEPWSIYQVEGNVLFDLLNILQGSDKDEKTME